MREALDIDLLSKLTHWCIYSEASLNTPLTDSRVGLEGTLGKSQEKGALTWESAGAEHTCWDQGRQLSRNPGARGRRTLDK